MAVAGDGIGFPVTQTGAAYLTTDRITERPCSFQRVSTNRQLDASETGGAHAQGIDPPAEKHERCGGIAGHFAAHTHRRTLEVGVGVADYHVDCVENGGMQGVARRRDPSVHSVCRENVLGEVVRPGGKTVETGRRGLSQEHGERHPAAWRLPSFPMSLLTAVCGGQSEWAICPGPHISGKLGVCCATW